MSRSTPSLNGGSSSSAPLELVIVGSGIIGLCTSYYLVTSPHLPSYSRITLVENSRSRLIAHGASSNAGGFLAGGNPDSSWFGPTTSALAELSFQCHKELAGKGIGEWGYRECAATGLRVGRGTQCRSAYRELPKGEKEVVEDDWLEGERENLDAEGGVGQLDPRQLCAALYHHLSSHSNFRAIFGQPTALNRPTPSSAGELFLAPHSSRTDPSPIPVTTLIISAGPWSSILCSTLNLPKLHLTNLPGHSLLIEPSPGIKIPPEAVFAGINGAEGGVHAATSGLARDLTPGEIAQGFTKAPELFTRTSGAIYVAGENSVPATRPEDVGIEPGEGPNKLPANVDDVEQLKDQRLVQRLKMAAAMVSGRLNEEKGARIEREQFCYRPVSPDGEPQIGKLTSNVFVATGHGPWGISLAPGTGRVLSELVLGAPTLSADISQLSPHRFE